MNHRIFISIKLPERVKKRLMNTIEKWRDLPIKWTPGFNLHITLVFLGFVSGEILQEICEKVRNLAANQDIFDLAFDRIALAPDKDNPKQVWLFGQDSPELLKLVRSLEKELDIESAAKKTFRPHVTLGRIQAGHWKNLAQKPDVFEKFAITIPAESADIMASHFKTGEKNYTILEECPLK